MLSVIHISAFAGCSSSGGTSCGVSPLAAGRKNAVAEPCTNWSAISCQISACPDTSRSPRSPWLAKRTTCEPTITCCRPSRSAQTPPTRKKTTCAEDAREEDEPEVAHRAGQVEHGERDRDRDEEVADGRDGLRHEDAAEVS